MVIITKLLGKPGMQPHLRREQTQAVEQSGTWAASCHCSALFLTVHPLCTLLSADLLSALGAATCWPCVLSGPTMFLSGEMASYLRVWFCSPHVR